MPLTYFPVTGTFKALISDASDAGGDPDTQNISAFIYFTPSDKQIFSAVDQTVYRLQPVRGRMNIADGEVKTIDGSTLTLVANSAALGLEKLYYTVTFSSVVYDKADQVMEGFTFEAPQDSTPVDLATVARVQL